MTDPLINRLDPRDFGEVARHVLDTPVYEWIRSGSGPDFAGDNEAAFGRRRLRPSVLVDVSAVRTETTLQGATVSAPVVVGPVGLQKAIHPDGELAMAAGASMPAACCRRGQRDHDRRDRGCPAELAPLDNTTGPIATLAAVIAPAEAPAARDRSAREHADRRQPPHEDRLPPAGGGFAHFDSSPEHRLEHREYLGWLDR
jgi:hypothetical protein